METTNEHLYYTQVRNPQGFRKGGDYNPGTIYQDAENIYTIYLIDDSLGVARSLLFSLPGVLDAMAIREYVDAFRQIFDRIKDSHPNFAKTVFEFKVFAKFDSTDIAFSFRNEDKVNNNDNYHGVNFAQAFWKFLTRDDLPITTGPVNSKPTITQIDNGSKISFENVMGYSDNVNGTTGNDEINFDGGSYTINTINGLAGDDVVKFKDGNYEIGDLLGGRGRDMFEFGDGDYDIDMVNAGNDADTMHFKEGSYDIDLVRGGRRQDNIRFDKGDYTIDEIRGNRGDDKIVFYQSNNNIDSVRTGSGKDYIAFYEGSSTVATVQGGGGNDRIDFNGDDHQIHTIRGDGGDDFISLSGSVHAIDIHGGEGNDIVVASGDKDIVRISGGAGDDFIDLFQGNNKVKFINGGDGTDTVQLAAGTYDIEKGEKGFLYITDVSDGNVYILDNVEVLAKWKGGNYTFNVAEGISGLSFVTNTATIHSELMYQFDGRSVIRDISGDMTHQVSDGLIVEERQPVLTTDRFTDEAGRIFHFGGTIGNSETVTTTMTGGDGVMDVLDYADAVLLDGRMPAVAVNLSAGVHTANSKIDGYTIRKISGGENSEKYIADLAGRTVQEYSFDGQGAGVKSLTSFEGAVGGRGSDMLIGNGSANYFIGEDGNDSIYGLGGDDEITGGDGNDWLSGGGGNDTIYGDGGNDILIGGSGSDRLFGGAGDDDIVSGLGNDELLVGGDGNDNFYLHSGNQLIWTGDQSINTPTEQHVDSLFIFVDDASEFLGTKTIEGYDNLSVAMVLAEGVTKGKWHFNEDASVNYHINGQNIVTIEAKTKGGSQKYLHTLLGNKITTGTGVGDALHRLAEESGASTETDIPNPFDTLFVDIA